MKKNREFQLIVWGCTGFTGRLVCDYLKVNYPTLKWAIAGRDYQKLILIKNKLGLKEDVEIVVSNIDNFESMINMAEKTNVVLSTAGPFSKIGTPLVEACIKAHTDYCDITGEPNWVKDLIIKFENEAQKNKVKIVNCCGFDSIPADLGVQSIVQEMDSKGLIPKQIRMILYDMKGGLSGGTLHSILNLFSSSTIFELLSLLSPFALNPLQKSKFNSKLSPKVPYRDIRLYLQACDNMVGGYDTVYRCFTAPYLMQSIDTRIVNRSNALTNWSYGENLLFTERMRVKTIFSSIFATISFPLMSFLLLIPFFRWILAYFLPKPGQGPSDNLLDNGHFTIKLWGKGIDPKNYEEKVILGSIVATAGDPGYRQTAKMVSEAAVCLALDQTLPEKYGFLTPSVAMGKTLRQRLNKKGLVFSIENN